MTYHTAHSTLEIADVRSAAGHALTIKLEHETQRGVGRGMLRPEVEDPTVGTLHMILEIFG